MFKNMNFEFLTTDFYQISMVFAFIMLDKANQETGYEGFVRNVKKEINEKQDFYIFSGEKQIVQYMEKIKEEIKNPLLVENFIEKLKGKVDLENWEDTFRNKFKKLNKDFTYTVAKEGSLIFPFVPAFQVKAPFWIGQMIETNGTNIYNGKTGALTTLLLNKKENKETLTQLVEIANNKKNKLYDTYILDLKNKAKEFVEVSKDLILLEAGFRRAISRRIAREASLISLESGFNGTSNTDLLNEPYFTEEINKKVGGTMAHAFVMNHKSELEAFKNWFKIYKHPTILVDTYDTINAVKLLIENDLKPESVRIDSGDFFTIPFEVRKLLDEKGWFKTKIYLSGDISVELIKELKAKKVPFNKIMVGTKFLYCNNIINKANAGFVYKTVQFLDEQTNEYIFATKKGENKSNYAGLKEIVKVGDNEYNIITNKNGKMDLSLLSEFNEKTKINFI